MRSLVSILALALLGGCSSTPEASMGGGGPTTHAAELTVVVVSLHRQSSVPAVGTITSLSDGSSRALDTRAHPDAGQTLVGLPPGRYRVEVRWRVADGGGRQAVLGEDAVYLEPGARRRLRVVTTDRRSDELGGSLLPGDQLEPASTPLLPLESAPG